MRPLFARMRSFWRGVSRPGQLESEMDEEMRFHIEMEAERLARERGFDAKEARRRAAVAFGGVEKRKEEARDIRGVGWVSGLMLDAKLGLRMLWKYPGLTVVGGIGMAVGTAVAAGFFSFSRSMMDPVVPLDEGDGIVALENWDVEANDESRSSLHDFLLWRESLESVEDVSAFRTVRRNLVRGRGTLPEEVRIAEMSAAGFEVARVPPLLGRWLVEADEQEGALPVMVIGYDEWQRRFSGSPGIVGQVVSIGTEVFTVVGVMPEGFAFPMNHSFWAPLRLDASNYPRGAGPEIFVFGRLVPGFTAEEAQAELATLGRRVAADFPESNGRLRPQVLPYTYPLLDIQDMRRWEWAILQFVASLILVVVAANVAVLVYARTTSRLGEVAVRSALGASRRRIVTQLFVEAFVLAAGAAAVGLALAHGALRYSYVVMGADFDGLPFWMPRGLSPAGVVYAAGLTVLVGVIVGVIPGLQATGRPLQASLRQLGGGTGIRMGRTWTALIVAQVAVAVAALPVAFAMGWDIVSYAAATPTFPAEEILVAELALEDEAIPRAEAESLSAGSRREDRLTELLRRVEAEPAVAGVTYATARPGREPAAVMTIEGAERSDASRPGHRVGYGEVGAAYFEALDAVILAGRALRPADAESASLPVVVNRAFVDEILGGSPAVGRRVRYLTSPRELRSVAMDTTAWREVVGVVDDLHHNRMDPSEVPPTLYHVVGETPARVSVLIRTHGDPADFARRLREITAAVDPALRLAPVEVFHDADEQQRLAPRLMAAVIGLVAVSVVLLSAAGIYALMSFTVTRRRREISIRIALGAQPRQIVRAIVSRASAQLAAGLAIGLGGAAAVDAATSGNLLLGFGPVLLVAFGAAMVAVGILATVSPARRGLRIQPMEALKQE